MLHGYCVRRASDPAPEDVPRGVSGAEVQVLTEGELALWYSELPRRPEVTVRGLQEHDAVVRAALRTATPLPLRFGSSFANAEEARRALRERSDSFIASLGEIANRLEMGIRVSAAAGGTARAAASEDAGAGVDRAPVRSGREYLEERRRELARADTDRRSAEAALDSVELRLADLNLPSHREIVMREGVLGLVAHLVHRQQVTLYRERVQQMAGELPGLELVSSGPWAPYSFV